MTGDGEWCEAAKARVAGDRRSASPPPGVCVRFIGVTLVGPTTASYPSSFCLSFVFNLVCSFFFFLFFPHSS